MKEKEVLKSLMATTKSIDHSYEMGRDCAINGPNTTNCHFSVFASREQTEAWERGKKETSEQDK